MTIILCNRREIDSCLNMETLPWRRLHSFGCEHVGFNQHHYEKVLSCSPLQRGDLVLANGHHGRRDLHHVHGVVGETTRQPRTLPSLHPQKERPPHSAEGGPDLNHILPDGGRILLYYCSRPSYRHQCRGHCSVYFWLDVLGGKVRSGTHNRESCCTVWYRDHDKTAHPNGG